MDIFWMIVPLISFTPHILFLLLCIDIYFRFRYGKSATFELCALGLLGALFYLSGSGLFSRHVYDVVPSLLGDLGPTSFYLIWLVPLVLVIIEAYRLAKFLSGPLPNTPGVTGVETTKPGRALKVFLSILVSLVFGAVSFVVLVFVWLTLWPPSE